MKSFKSIMSSAVAKTDFGPFRLVYRQIYLFGAHFIKKQLLELPGVLGIYVTGSFVSNEELHGASDLDLYVVLENTYEQDEAFRERLNLIYRRCCLLFPFLQPIEERLAQVVFLDRDGLIGDPVLLFRHKSNRLNPLYEKNDFSLSKLCQLSDCAMILAELSIQVKVIAKQLLKDTDDLYFWKARMRAINLLLQQSLGENHQFSADDLITRLLKTKSSKLYRARNEEKHSYCFKAFLQGSSQIMQHLQNQNLDHKLIEFEWVGQGDPSLCFSWTGQTPKRANKIQAKDLSYDDLKRALRSPPVPNEPIVCFFEHFVVSFDDAFIGTCFTTPWLFASFSKDEDCLYPRSKIAFIKEFWQYQNKQIALALDDLKQALLEILSPDTRSNNRHVVKYFRNDHQFISTLLSAYRLSCLTPDKYTVFSGSLASLEHLRQNLPSQAVFVDILTRYVASFEKGTNKAVTKELPSNFFGYAAEVFKALLTDSNLPDPADLHKRLTLSVCIITRDRAKLLGDLLDSLTKQQRPANEVVIIDNSSSQETKAVVDRYRHCLPIKYAFWESHNIPELRNQAILTASSEIICFADDDCLVSDDWLAHAERTFLRSNSIGAAWGKVLIDQNHVSGSILRMLRE